MTEDLTIPANVLLSRLVPLVSQDAQLLAILRGLARGVPEADGGPRSPRCADRRGDRRRGTARPGSGRPRPPPPQHVPLPSAPGIEIPVGWFRRLVAAESDLQLIEARCRLEGRRGTLGGGPAAESAGWGRLLHRDRAQGSGDHQQGQDPGRLLPVDEPLQCPDPRRSPAVGGCCRLLRGGGDGGGPPAASDRERGEVPGLPRKSDRS